MTYKIFDEKNKEVAQISCASLDAKLSNNEFYIRTGEDGMFSGEIHLADGFRVEMVKPS